MSVDTMVGNCPKCQAYYEWHRVPEICGYRATCQKCKQLNTISDDVVLRNPPRVIIRSLYPLMNKNGNLVRQ